jgi:hypothetical protein
MSNMSLAFCSKWPPSINECVSWEEGERQNWDQAQHNGVLIGYTFRKFRNSLAVWVQ